MSNFFLIGNWSLGVDHSKFILPFIQQDCRGRRPSSLAVTGAMANEECPTFGFSLEIGHWELEVGRSF
jgi:hypothetical protein